MIRPEENRPHRVHLDGRADQPEQLDGGQVEHCGVFLTEARESVLEELARTLQHVSLPQVDQLAAELAAARRIVTLGAGRSKLAVDSFAMRLTQMGLAAYVSAEVTSPAVTDGDLIIVCSGSGETPTVTSVARSARLAGARVVTVTGAPGSSLADLADLVVVLREYGRDGTADRGEQFVGTLFEQSALILFDILVLALEKAGAADAHAMLARHTNLE